MSLVTKAYVFDLRPGSSFVESLLARGFDVYSLDWGIPDAVESANSFETYCDEYLPRAAAAVLETSGMPELTVYGYCFGGVLSLIFVGGHPEIPVRSLGIMATPIDFSVLGAVPTLLAEGGLDVEDFLDDTGNVPPDVMLNGIRSFAITGDLSSYANLFLNLDDPQYVAAHEALVGWAQDHIPFPGATMRQTVDWFMRDTCLARGEIPLAGHDVDLRDITCPVLNVVGDADHLITLPSNAPIVDVLSDVDDMHFPMGHVGLIVGRSAQRHSIPGIAGWLEAHSETR
jgi:polyhydroxyalkanoate synthase